MRGQNACVKCQHIDIIHVPGGAHNDSSESGANISLGRIHGNVLVDRYVCGNCGYVETWVQPGEIEKLRLHFQS